MYSAHACTSTHRVDGPDVLEDGVGDVLRAHAAVEHLRHAGQPPQVGL